MKNELERAAILAALAFLAGGCAGHARPAERGEMGEAMEQGPEGGEENEQEVAYGSLPAVVRTAAEGALSGATDLSAEKETEEGVTHFEVQGKRGGKGVTVTLSEAGELVELETEIAFSQLPDAAQARLRADHPDASFEIVELVQPRYFEVKFKVGGKWREVQVYPSGLRKRD